MSSTTTTAAKPTTVTYLTFGVVTVQLNGKWKTNFWLIAYYVVCILLAANICTFFWGRGQTLACMAIAPMLLLVFIFFGLRWFPPDKIVSPTTTACKGTLPPGITNFPPFPPIVNMCPDFMTAWTDSRNDKVYCYDSNNTYNMKSYKGAGLTSGLTINGLGGQSAYLLFDPTKNIGKHNPMEDDGGLRWPLYYLLDNKLSTITGDVNGKYLTWEGILEPSGTLYAAWGQNMLRLLPGLVEKS